MANIILYPDNDLVVKVRLRQASASTGAVTDLTSGTVTAFISLSNLTTATPADASLSVACTYSGSSGWWVVAFDATILTSTLLNTLFASAAPYLIVQQVGGIAGYAPMTYSPSRLMTVA